MKIDITLDEALAKASYGLRKKMEYTIEVIRKAEPLALKYDAEKGFWVGVSFGKDSQALFHMMQLSGVKFHSYFSPTSIDPPEVIRFGRKYYPEVQFGKLSYSIYESFKKGKVLPSMRIRWCCADFKERGGEGKVVCTGVRKAESVKRSKRNEIEVSGKKFSGHIDEFEDWQEKKIRKQMKNLNQDQFAEAKENEIRCINGHDKILLNPIIEWTESDIWEFLNKVVEVPHCELYDQGWTRIGCICCPMASVKNTLRDIKRWPYVKEKWIRAIMDVRKESILGSTPSESECRVFTINGLCPPQKGHRRGHSRLSQANTSGWGRHNGGSHGTFNNCKSGFGEEYKGGGNCKESRIGAEQSVSPKLPPPLRGIWSGKFLDGGNGESSAVVAEYDEEKERKIAEEIFDWWISKESFAVWFSKRYLQSKLFSDEDFIEDGVNT